MPSPPEQLVPRLEAAMAELPAITNKKMFGCEAYWADGTVFAMIWKAGRITLKLPDPTAYAELLALPGAAPWHAGEKTMAHWAFVPEAFHDDAPALARWVRRAHDLALAAALQPRPAARKRARS